MPSMETMNPTPHASLSSLMSNNDLIFVFTFDAILSIIVYLLQELESSIESAKNICQTCVARERVPMMLTVRTHQQE